MEKPILFNTEMVRAILAGRKTQTRRFIKRLYIHEPYATEEDGTLWISDENGEYYRAEEYAPYKSGDLLYVRETWNYGYVDSDWKEGCPPEYWFEELDWKGKDHDFLRGISRFWYLADDDEPLYGLKWKPSIHMPRAAARIFLKVKRVRAERLKDITEEDAVAEGFEADDVFSARERFAMTWNSVYYGVSGKKTPENWASNPWVWVIEFEKMEGRHNDD